MKDQWQVSRSITLPNASIFRRILPAACGLSSAPMYLVTLTCLLIALLQARNAMGRAYVPVQSA
jgi:hypothetical protein